MYVRLALLLLSVSLWHSVAPTYANNYQQCLPNESCVIGEFLYDDDYSPLPGQSCTLTAKYPDGTPYLSSQALVDRGDGWYSYTASIGSTLGLYSATICCTPSSGLMCLDKSFEVKASVTGGSSLTPADIWGYSNRTLTSYGSLVSDIWGYSSRSLTSFGSLVSDIWGHSSRTMTSFGSLVESIWGGSGVTTTTESSPTGISAIIAEQRAQRELLERLVNAPIISLSLEDGASIPDLETKIDDSKKHASSLYTQISSAKSRLMVLDTKWDRLTQEAILNEITAVSALFQNSSELQALAKSWDTQAVRDISVGTDQLNSQLSLLLSSTSLKKERIAPSSLVSALTTLSDLENVLGDSTSVSSDNTLFGYLESVHERHQTLLSENQKITAVLENLSGQGTSSTQKEVNSLKSRLLALNQYPAGASLINPAKASSDQKLNFKNILYSLQALIGLNTQLLALDVGQPVRSLWLEEGSIIFRAVITNPSSLITQTVPLKFYLPREIKTDDILELDPSLSTTYDASEEALYVSGSYTLAPNQTKLVYVEVEDIWFLTEAEITTLRTQAAELLAPLAKTAYFSQGTVLKSEIDVTLDKILLSTGKAITPENRIRTYREAQLELSKVGVNMDRLQDLVAQSSGTGSIFGFVGGVQTIAVWGLIIVVVAGFVFLTIYFKKIGLTPPPKDTQTEAPTLPSISLETKPHPAWQTPALISLVVVITASVTVALTRLARPTQEPVINQISSSPLPTSTPTPIPSPSPTATPGSIDVTSEKSILGEQLETHTLTVPADSSVNIRALPNPSADIVMAIKTSLDVYVFKTQGDWTQIGFTSNDQAKGYWVHSQFLSPLDN